MLCEVLRVADDGGEGWCCVRCSGWLADDRKEEAGVPERDKRIPPNHPLQPTEAVFSVLVWTSRLSCWLIRCHSVQLSPLRVAS